MKKIIYIISIIGVTIFTQSCKESNSSNKSITKEVTFTKEGELKIKKAANDSIYKTLDLEIAETEYETQTGLMYRHSMEDNQAMLFIFKESQQRSFYMKNTEFALDIIFINTKKEIVNFHKNAEPYNKTSLPSDGPIKYVLEINAGLSDNWGLEKGDLIEWSTN